MSFKPQYNITPLLLANIKQITALVTTLNSQHFPRLVVMELERTARAVSSHASTSIEGNPLPLTEVKKILKTAPAHLRDSEREVLNYNRVLEELNKGLKTKPIRFNLSFLLKIQQTVTDGLISQNRSGKLRNEPVLVNDPKAGRIVYLPPNHEDVKSLMGALIKFVEQNRHQLDPLILAGLFHRQFVVIHPFVDGNGRTARLATKALLADLGLDTFNLFSFENYYNRNISQYFATVGLQGDYYDLKESIDFTAWLEYFTAGIIDELLRVGKELHDSSLTPERSIKPQHKIIIDYIKKHGYIADRDYAKLTSRAKPTRHLDFNKLIDLRQIVRKGKGKSTYYVFPS